MAIWQDANVLSAKLEASYELWTWNGLAWNKEPIKGVSGTAISEAFERQVRVMPNCPTKIVKVTEIFGN